MGEYQYKCYRNYILPTAIYHQCIWIIRDMERMEKKVTYLNDNVILNNIDMYKSMKLSESHDELSRLSGEISVIDSKLSGIYSALDKIPTEYQNGLLDNIINHRKYEDYAHENTWKKWKQRFIYYVAENLRLY